MCIHFATAFLVQSYSILLVGYSYKIQHITRSMKLQLSVDNLNEEHKLLRCLESDAGPSYLPQPYISSPMRDARVTLETRRKCKTSKLCYRPITNCYGHMPITFKTLVHCALARSSGRSKNKCVDPKLPSPQFPILVIKAQLI